MLHYCERSLRKQAIIHFLASTGIIPAALIDPVLKIKHLKSLPNPNDLVNPPHYCYGIQVYDESKEAYWVFLTKSLFSCKSILVMKDICKLIERDPDFVKGTNDFEVEELEDFGSTSSVDEIISGDATYGK